jgi:hypothetical protein
MMSASLPPLPKGAELRQFLSTVRMLLDNKRAEEILNLLAAGVADHERSLGAMRRERAALETARSEHRQAIEGERAEHTAQLERERSAWASEQTKRLDEIQGMERQAKAALDQATKDRDAAAKLKAEWQSKAQRIAEAVAA